MGLGRFLVGESKIRHDFTFQKVPPSLVLDSSAFNRGIPPTCHSRCCHKTCHVNCFSFLKSNIDRLCTHGAPHMSYMFSERIWHILCEQEAHDRGLAGHQQCQIMWFSSSPAVCWRCVRHLRLTRYIKSPSCCHIIYQQVLRGVSQHTSRQCASSSSLILSPMD